MLDRIRRKLFLSVKIMGSNNSSENTSLGSSELLDILRKGSSALMRSDDSMDLSQFLDASLDDILQDSKKVEEMRDVIFKRDVKKEECTSDDTKLLEDAEEEERRLLKGVAQVQSRFFEGRMIQRQTNTEIANEWQDLQKRARTGRTVNIGGMAFIVSESPAPEVVSFILKVLCELGCLSASWPGSGKTHEKREDQIRIRRVVQLLSRWGRTRPV